MNLQLKTEISAEFLSDVKPTTPEEISNLESLNFHVEDACERLQPVFRALIIEILNVKREGSQTTQPQPQQEAAHEGSKHPDIPSDS